MKISSEQLIIINEVKNGNNVSINSVAGSGKTTTQFFIAEEFSDLKILTLTYNAMLRHESKIRLKSMKNMTVHTFHSFCCKNYCNGYTNNTISNAINLKDEVELNYDMIVIDEAQDLTDLLYRFILRILADNNKEPILLIFGDDRQAIYKYMGSNSDYLTNSSKYFKSSRPWVNRELNVSYRLTENMCGAINHFLGSNKIISGNKNSNNKVEYKICDSFKVYESIKQTIIKLITDGVNYSDIMIIAPSIKSNNKKKYNLSPVRRLAHEFISFLPIFIPNEGNKDESILKNKIMFTTFHQSKGLQRKIVVVYNVDESYNKFYNKEGVPGCPNAIYVALSRATERLIIIQDMKQLPFNFINLKKLSEYCDITGCQAEIKELPQETKINKISVTDLVGNCDMTIEDLKFSIVNEAGKLVKINSTIKNVNYYKLIKAEVETTEDISMINGVAIPNFIQFAMTGNCNLNYSELNSKNQNKLRKLLDKPEFDIDYICNMDSSESNKFVELWLKTSIDYVYRNEPHLISQINNFSWLSVNDFIDIYINIIGMISPRADFEVPIEYLNYSGIIDCIDRVNKIVWEFKCVSELNEKHKIQLLVYMGMLKNPRYDGYRFYLCNLLSGEIIEIYKCEFNLELFNKIVG